MEKAKNMARNMFFYLYSKEILQFYHTVLIKGEALSIQAYNMPGCRRSSDIDILVDRNKIRSMTNLLNSNGFVQKNISPYDKIIHSRFSHQVAPFIKTVNQMEIYIDLNYDIFWGEYEGNRIDIDKFLSDCLCQVESAAKGPLKVQHPTNTNDDVCFK